MGKEHRTLTHTFRSHPCPKCEHELYVFADVEAKSIEKRIGNFLQHMVDDDLRLSHSRRRVWIRYVCHSPRCGWKGNWIKIQDTIKGTTTNTTSIEKEKEPSQEGE